MRVAASIHWCDRASRQNFQECTPVNQSSPLLGNVAGLVDDPSTSAQAPLDGLTPSNPVQLADPSEQVNRVLALAQAAPTATYNEHSYQLTSGASSWEAAQAEAAQLGGHLVVINDAAEQRWLNDTFGESDRLWIGLTDRDQEGNFQWVNGDSSSYQNWAPGEPNDYKFGGQFTAGEDYVLMNWNGAGRWNDAPNSFAGSFQGIIEIPNSVQEFETYNGNRYQLTSGKKSWTAAQQEAEAAGGHLVTVNDAAEQSWLNQTFGSSERLWIGLTDQGQEGNFQWVNGEGSGYRHWAPGEPNDYKFGGRFNGGEDYSVMNWNSAGQWNDFPNSFAGTFRGVIEIPGSNPPPPPVSNSGSDRLEAESVTLGGGASTNTNHPGFSGKGFVDRFTSQGASATFSVNVDSAGQYNTTLRYANGPNGPSQNGQKTLSLYVNGVDVKQTQLDSTGNWQSWKNQTEVLNLNAGRNTISYRYDSGDTGWVNLDYIWTSKAVGNGVVDQPITDQGLAIGLEKVVQLPNDSTGNSARMIGMTSQGNRNFVYEERDGNIYELVTGNNGQTTAQLFFDVGDAVQTSTGRNLNTSNVTHGGLKGVAFHPDFANNGKFYTSQMEDRPGNPNLFNYLSDVSNPIQADSVVAEWTYNFNTNRVNANSYREVLRIGMPVFDHPIKEISFNPLAGQGSEDFGLLYVTHGDGSIQSATAGGGLRKDALGKILRINPLQSGGQAYTVPGSNPFVGDNRMLDEVYSLGHRNPHTISFAQDSSGNNRIIVGEAGRDNIEEINLIEAGGNYGWSEREGTFVHLQQGGGIVEGLAPLPADEASKGYVYPAAQWGHEGPIGAGFVGQAVAGGYVGRAGSAIAGQYLFGDFAKSGQIYHSRLSDLISSVTTLDPNDSSRDEPTELTQAQIGTVKIRFDHDNNANTAPLVQNTMLDVLKLEGSYDGSGRADIRFGQGGNGEIYITNKRNGQLYRVTSSVV